MLDVLSFSDGGERGGRVSLTSSNKKSSVSISGEESTMKYSIPGYLFFDNTQRKLKIKHL